MTDDSTVVGVRVSASRKAELEEYVDGRDEYKSLPDLFRHAVAHELSDDYGPLTGDGEVDTGLSGGEITELKQQISELHGDMKDMNAAVSEVQEHVQADSTVPGSVIGDVFEMIPEGPYKEGISASDVADELDISKRDAAIALAQLHQETGLITGYGDGSGEIRYTRDSS